MFYLYEHQLCLIGSYLFDSSSVPYLECGQYYIVIVRKQRELLSYKTEPLLFGEGELRN